MKLNISVLVPTNDRPHVVALVWQSWINQDGVAELILVNDGSSADYTEIVQTIERACNSRSIVFKYIKLESRVGSPAAKNIGLNHCSGDYVLTTDDDIFLPKNMIELCNKNRHVVGNDAIFGPRVIYQKNNETQEAALARSNMEVGDYFDYKKLKLTPWILCDKPTKFPFVTAVAVWPNKYFKEGLRYYEGYGGNGYREETDPQLVAQKDFGAEIWLIPEAVCYHLPPNVAYANKSGQRRGGVIWFEYWVLKNNLTFLNRHSALLKKKYKINIFSSWIWLACERFSINRLRNFFNKNDFNK